MCESVSFVVKLFVPLALLAILLVRKKYYDECLCIDHRDPINWKHFGNCVVGWLEDWQLIPNLVTQWTEQESSLFITRDGFDAVGYPQLAVLEDHAAEIRDEFWKAAAAVGGPDFNRVPTTNELAGQSDTYPENWKFWVLVAQGIPVDDNLRWFPRTWQLLQQAGHELPFNALFSILAPDTEVKTHKGYSRAFFRYLLGVDVPSDHCARLHAISNRSCCSGEEFDSGAHPIDTYAFRTGHGIIFDDTTYHFSENRCPTVRIVLYLDLIRDFGSTPWGVVSNFLVRAGLWLAPRISSYLIEFRQKAVVNHNNLL